MVHLKLIVVRMADFKVTIAKLNNSNYQVWKYKLELLLMKEGLWDVVKLNRPKDPDDVWFSKDGKARATIGLLVEDNQLGHIKKCSTAKEMWNTLQGYHQKSTLSNKVSLLKRLCSLKLSEGDDIEEHINSMSNLIDQLSALGEILAEQLTVALLLSSLPESYSTLITALETRPEKDLTQELVKNKLIEEYKRRKEMKGVSHQKDEKAFKANYETSKYQKDNKGRACYFCKKIGHEKINCRKYKIWKEKNLNNEKKFHKVNNVNQWNIEESEKSEENISFMTSDTKLLSEWFIDSGATSHMTNDLKFFAKVDMNIREFIYLADHKRLVTAGKGEGYISCVDDLKKVRKILVKDVLYVPELQANLLSVRRLVDKGFLVKFVGKQCIIKLNDKVIAMGKMKNSLYTLNVHHALNIKEGNHCIHEWHKRLGHRDIQAIKTLAYNELATGIEIKACNHSDECEVCVKAKMTRNSFPKKSESETTEILDLVHSDVCGPMQVAIPETNRHKLNEKALKRVFVGYEEGSKAYRLLDPNTSKVMISRNVKFLKNLSQIDKEGSELNTNSIESCPETININRENFSDEESEAVVEICEKENKHVSEVTETGDDDEKEKEAENSLLRRSSRITKGKAPARLEIINIVSENETEPKSYSEAITSKESIYWKHAMNEEMKSLKQNNTWDIVKLPENKQTVKNKWIFKRKLDEKGNVNRYKARLVAQGYSQKYGEEYDEVFAPVVRQTTFRALLTVAGKRKMSVKHYDIETAYLNGDIHHEIYMNQPEGYEVPGKEHYVCKLKRSLYGLKQSANEWNKKLNDSLIQVGFKQGEIDPCLYVKYSRGTWIYVLIYVDDLIAASTSNENLSDFESDLKSFYKMKDLGDIKFYLGINVERDSNGIFYLHQGSYINRKINEFGFEDCKPSKIPLEPGYMKRNEVEDPLETNNTYRKAIGSLLYISTNTRPDIAVSTSILASKVSEPTQSDWTEVKRIFRYLKTTLNKKLKLGSEFEDENENLEGYVDANWGGDENRRSNTGYLFQVYGGTICWSSKRQKSVALSSAEAEYIALAESVQEAIWLDKLLKELNVKVEKPIVINEDNQSCIKMLNAGKFRQRTKHIDIKYHFVRELVADNFISVKYCPSTEMKADLLTKPLESVKLAKFTKAIGLV